MEDIKLNGFNNGRDTSDGVGGRDPYTDDAPKTLRNKVFEALGEVSMCWSETPKGVFESSRAEEIGNRLMEDIEKEIDIHKDISLELAKEASGKFFLMDVNLLDNIQDLDKDALIRLASQRGVQVVVPQISVKTAVEVLCKALREDKSEGSYYYSWQANIAMAFQDECNREVKTGRQWWMDKDCHRISNQAAKNFLNLLIKE